MRVISENEDVAFQELDRKECLQLLGWEYIGRLATPVPGHGPEVVPVNFVLDGESVVFRCAAARAAIFAGRHASFEIDRFDPFHRSGWSVVVSGVLERVPADSYPAGAVEAWAPGDRQALLRLRVEDVTGRRIAQRPWHDSNLGYL